MWYQGWDKVPDIVSKCLSSWEKHNPEWQIIKLDKDNIFDYVPQMKSDLPKLATNPRHTCDVVRIYLMRYLGGVYVDATTFCMKPLDEWIPEGTFLFSNPLPGRLIANWFQKSEPHTYLYQKYLEEVIDYWNFRINYTDQYEMKTYIGWPFTAFGLCYERDPLFKDQWDATHKISSKVCSDKKDPDARGEGTHYLTHHPTTTTNEVIEEDIKRFESKIDPLYKLTKHYKVKPNSTMGYLLSNY